MQQSQSMPVWDNSSEYRGFYSEEFLKDMETARQLIAEIETLNKLMETDSSLRIAKLQEISTKAEAAFILILNLRSFAHCEKSVDSKNDKAGKAISQIHQLWADYNMAVAPRDSSLKLCDEATLELYLASEQTRVERFFWTDVRRLKDFSLSVDEEKAIAQFETFGLTAWGDLYSEISGDLKVQVGAKEMSLAQAAGLLRAPDENIRRDAWQGIQKAWKQVEIPAAAVLNNLVGYRLELYKKRSHTKKMHFMDMPLHQSRIEMATLDAMLGAIEDTISLPLRAQKAMAKALGKKQLDPWDTMAPSPRISADAKYPFNDGISMVTEAFTSVHPQMGEFVTMMLKNNWIDPGLRPNKAPGAYCTGFAKSKTPRVFQTYMGSMKDVSTLAHELGHAYHSWVMRDLPWAEGHYPMTVAETASIFSETLLAERLFNQGDTATKFTIAWEDTAQALSMLVNIPTRYELEKNIYEARTKGPLTPGELNALTDKAFRKYYGEGLSQTESQFWMTKMHFSFSEISFYNYPYTFGYLFSLGIYALREKLGTRFHQAYVDILRDSGRLSVEDLIQKHLGADIRQKDFWLQSLKIIEQKVVNFEQLLEA